MARILEDMKVTELAWSAGLCVKHNWHRLWRLDGLAWGQATLCCTRYLPMTAAAAETIRLAAEQASISAHHPVVRYLLDAFRQAECSMPCNMYTVAGMSLGFWRGETRSCLDCDTVLRKSGLFWWQGMFERRPADTVGLDGVSDDEWSTASSDDDPGGGEMQLVPGLDAERNPGGVWTYNGMPFFGVMHAPV